MNLTSLFDDTGQSIPYLEPRPGVYFPTSDYTPEAVQRQCDEWYCGPRTVHKATALSDLCAGEIVAIEPRGARFDRMPTARNPCTAKSLVCTRSARRGAQCEYVVNGPMESDHEPHRPV